MPSDGPPLPTKNKWQKNKKRQHKMAENLIFQSKWPILDRKRVQNKKNKCHPSVPGKPSSQCIQAIHTTQSHVSLYLPIYTQLYIHSYFLFPVMLLHTTYYYYHCLIVMSHSFGTIRMYEEKLFTLIQMMRVTLLLIKFVVKVYFTRMLPNRERY